MKHLRALGIGAAILLALAAPGCGGGGSSSSTTPPASSPSITTSSLPSGTVGTAYNATLEASGGTAPYTWSITSGSLPDGLSLNTSTGAISGTPTTAGTSNFTAKVTDAGSRSDTKALTITVSASANVGISISPTSSTVGYGGTQQFTATVTGSTNTGVTWSVSSASSSSSSQIGTISSSGLYTAPAASSLPSGTAPQMVSVVGGSATSSVDIAVPPLNATDSVTVTATSQADTSKSASATVTLSGLSIIAMGQCIPSTSNPNQLSCTHGSTGISVSRSQSAGQTIYVLVVGYGILPGTTYSISGNDIVVTQPTSAGGNFKTTNNGIPAVYFQIVVPSTAALGPRNLVVTNSGNELASFAGGLSITQ